MASQIRGLLKVRTSLDIPESLALIGDLFTLPVSSSPDISLFSTTLRFAQSNEVSLTVLSVFC
jgi:hypothetical protein